MLHLAPVVLTMRGDVLRDAGVAVDGSVIAEIGDRTELLARHPRARVREHGGVLTPGLVNAHTHLEYSDHADLCGTGGSFVDWIRQFPGRNAAMTPGAWLEAARRGIHQLLRAGVTAAADIIASGPGIRAAAMTGLAGISYVEIVGVDNERWPEKRDRLHQVLATAPAGRSVGLSPHSAYSISVDVLDAVVAHARASGMRLHPHVAETQAEVEYVHAGSGEFADANRAWGFEFELLDRGAGRSPVQFLADRDALLADTHIAHGVHVDAADRAVLRERAVAVALCVRSNAMLGAGEPPVAQYRAEGNVIAIGTDSLASCPSLDVLEELGAVREIAIRQGSPETGLAQWLVEAATRGGAIAMGLGGRIGELSIGARADFAVFDVPTDGDPYESLIVHGTGRCTATVLAGRLVHRAKADR